MATERTGIKVQPATARAAELMLSQRARLKAAVNGSAAELNAEQDVYRAGLRGELAGIDEALAALWAATLGV